MTIMKELLIQAADRSGVVNADMLRQFFDEHAEDDRRLDQVLMTAPNFTEDVVLRLFAEALGVSFFDEIEAQYVPQEFVESVPAPYAQHHYLIGYRPESQNGRLLVITANPLNVSVIDNVSKMLGCPWR